MQETKRFKGVIDTTLRDGQQSPLMFDAGKYRFSLEDKTSLVNGLIQIGVRNIELFSPVVGPIERQGFIDIKAHIAQLAADDVRVLAHVRSDQRDIDQALEAGCDGLNLYIGASERAQQSSHGKSLPEIIDQTAKTLESVRSQHPQLYMRFSAEDFFRTNPENTYHLYDTVSPYVQTLGMPDTVGVATPSRVAQAVQSLRNRYPDHDIECHFHNDRGYALINAVTAVLSGASYIDTSIWGIAERSGITSLTALLFNLYHEDPDLCQDYQLSLAYPLNVLLGSILQLHVPWSEPVSLTNRTHTAGVHQKAVLRDPTVYEAHNLEGYGVNKHQLLLGPLSGWNLIYYYLREVMYFDVTIDMARTIARDFKNAADKMNPTFSPDELLIEVTKTYNVPKLAIAQSAERDRLENI